MMDVHVEKVAEALQLRELPLGSVQRDIGSDARTRYLPGPERVFRVSNRSQTGGHARNIHGDVVRLRSTCGFVKGFVRYNSANTWQIMSVR